MSWQRKFVVFAFWFSFVVFGCWIHRYMFEYVPSIIERLAPAKTEPEQPQKEEQTEPDTRPQHAHNHDPTGKPPEVVVFLFEKIQNKVYCVHAINFSRYRNNWNRRK